MPHCHHGCHEDRGGVSPTVAERPSQQGGTAIARRCTVAPVNPSNSPRVCVWSSGIPAASRSRPANWPDGVRGRDWSRNSRRKSCSWGSTHGRPTGSASRSTGHLPSGWPHPACLAGHRPSPAPRPARRERVRAGSVDPILRKVTRRRTRGADGRWKARVPVVFAISLIISLCGASPTLWAWELIASASDVRRWVRSPVPS